jgi:hypothetical protein
MPAGAATLVRWRLYVQIGYRPEASIDPARWTPVVQFTVTVFRHQHSPESQLPVGRPTGPNLADRPEIAGTGAI